MAHFWISDYDSRAGDAHREPSEFKCASFEKRRAEQQVFGRVSTERQFGRDHQVRAAAPASIHRIENARRVAGKIADHLVQLGDRDAHGSNFTMRTGSGPESGAPVAAR
jgi:hypothetical protein